MTPKTFSMLDRPGVLQSLFHPRPSPSFRSPDAGREDFLVPMPDGVRIGASLHFKDKDAPLLLFFHGNGEIVPDYDDLGQAFTRGAGVNFFVADYRGYGDSEGSPTVAAMLDDAGGIFAFVEKLRTERGMTGGLSVMGRSLGSAPALELAASEGIHSLIIESGFAFAGPLLRVLGLDPDAMGFREEDGMGNLDKMKQVACPCLVIHAEQDILIPFSDGRALYDACVSETKKLLKIKGAGHNDIFIHGMAPYLEQVKAFCR
jgi:fermentation-respiration switch protein FrsA (DUF1100 family)